MKKLSILNIVSGKNCSVELDSDSTCIKNEAEKVLKAIKPDINKVPCSCGQYYAMLDHCCYPWVGDFNKQFSHLFQGSIGQIHKEAIKNYINRNFTPK